MRQLVLSPRWILWHLLTLGAVVTCLWLAAWQWQRAGSAMGSALNIGYGLQWPVFAVFFGVMWWRFLRMEVARLQVGRAATASADAAARRPADGPGRCAPRCTAPNCRPWPVRTQARRRPAGPRRRGFRPGRVQPDAGPSWPPATPKD